jgi:SAM-dependent methyltransferase
MGQASERPAWAPKGIDLDRPNAARMYDYALGGSHNFAVDREMVERIETIMPGSSLIAHANRAFLQRAVRFLLGAGIRQFLDLGAGIPTVGPVHEVAQERVPNARVVYVDADPVAVAHGRALLADNPFATALQGDVRDAGALLADPHVERLLDLSEPVAVLLIAVLHFIPDEDDPAAIVAAVRDRIAPGSYLVLSHATPDEMPGEAQEVGQVYRSTATPITMRNREQIARMFDGFDLVEPGLTWVTEWRPDEDALPRRREMLVGVGRKR